MYLVFVMPGRRTDSNPITAEIQVRPRMDNRTLISHERTSVHFLVLAGSVFSITEFTYFSLIKTLAQFKYKSD
jgi:hypothetical protein